MKKYKITDIIEDEFGCEGRPEGEEPMVTILLVDDTGKQRSIRMADKLAYEKKLDVGMEMELPEEEIMTLNGKEYKVKKLLGKGKGGYSYLVTDGEKEYVLKQIHHEPCSYYQFDNKLEAEKRDYKRLMEIGITMPKLLDIDETQEAGSLTIRDEKTTFRCPLKTYSYRLQLINGGMTQCRFHSIVIREIADESEEDIKKTK